MIILGIDPGSRITGYGLVKKEGNRTTHLDNGIILCPEKLDFATRLELIFSGVQEIILKHRPDVLAVEDIFYSQNVKSALKLGHARGAVMVAARNMGIKVVEYTHNQVKLAVTGFGHAGKEQMQKMVKALLNLPEVAEENASDALAVALCHSHSNEKLGHAPKVKVAKATSWRKFVPVHKVTA